MEKDKIDYRNSLSFILSILSYLFLVPGVYLSMLTIRTDEAIKASIGELKFSQYDTSNSILSTVKNLYESDFQFVAVAIFIFSVIVPVIKGALLTYSYFAKNARIKRKLYKWITSIAKWSMCDVFIVAIFLAYLSSGARVHNETHQLSAFIFSIDVHVYVKMKAQLEMGFYCFLSYCLLSLAALQLYCLPEE